jgi:hypothetical protein
MQTDTIIAFAIAQFMQKCPELVQADILKLMRRQAELEENNQELRRLVDRSQVAGIKPGGP